VRAKSNQLRSLVKYFHVGRRVNCAISKFIWDVILCDYAEKPDTHFLACGREIEREREREKVYKLIDTLFVYPFHFLFSLKIDKRISGSASFSIICVSYIIHIRR
jgi:hypothetical protein